MKLIDLSKFEKVAEDKTSATMKHKDGHEMKILIKALQPIQREQLKRLKMKDGGKVKMYEEGSKDEPVSKEDAAPVADVTPPPAVEAPAAAIAPVQQSQQTAALPVNQPVVAPAPNLINPTNANPLAPIQEQQQASKGQAVIDAEKAKAQAGYEDQYLKERQRLASQDQDNFNELKGHTDDFKQYVQQNPIDAQKYAKGMGTGEKIANAVGLLIGGFGSAKMFGGTNYAYEYLNKQTDRDIDAQKTNTTNQQNVYKAYEHLYGDSVIASNLAKVSANDMLSHQAAATAAKLGTAQAQVNANNFQAAKALENNKLLMDSSYRLGDLRRANGSTPGVAAAPTAVATAEPPSKGGPNAPPPPPENTEGPKTAGYSEAALHGKGMGIGKMTPSSEEEKPYVAPPVTSLLRPDADKIMGSLPYNPTAPVQEDLPGLRAQMTGARQADKALSDIGPTFTKMANERNGLSGRIHRNLSPHALAGLGAIGGAALAGIPTLGIAAAPAAGVGATAGEAIGQGAKALTNTETNRGYDSDQTALLGYISSALAGTNVGGGQIQEVVDKNSPETGDSKEILDKKMQNIQDFIRNHTKTDVLERHNLINRQK